jgi:cytoskeletal protein CcmA (bactofilin family)
MDNDVYAKTLNWQPEPHDDDAGAHSTDHPKPGSPPKSHGDATDRRREMSVLGRSVVFKGELEAQEDLVIDGRVEGTINHRAEHLTIGPHGDIKADILAQRVLVQGRVVGNIRATETIIIEPSAHVAGNLFAPRVGLKEGAEFDGRIQMTRAAEDASKTKPADTRAASVSAAKDQPGERVDVRGAASKRASASSKKSAAGGGAIGEASVDDLLD